MADLNIRDESRLAYYGWVVAIASLAAGTIAQGVGRSFGVFLKPMLDEFHWGRGAISGVFAVYFVAYSSFGVVTGHLTDRLGPRIVVGAGALCISVALFLTSRVSSLWQLYLYFGVLFGLGGASLYAPLVATVARWFVLRRGLATGMVVSSIGFGTLVVSPLSGWLIGMNGWRTTFVVLSLISLVIMIPATLLLKYAPQEKPAEAGSGNPPRIREGFSLGQAVRTRAFWAHSIAWLFLALALQMITVHLVPLAVDMGIPSLVAASFVGLAGGCSVVGRMGLGIVADRVGRKRALVIAAGLQLVMLVWLLLTTSTWMFYVFAVVFGFAFGSWAGQMPALPADYFGLKSTGSIIGLVMVLAGFGGGVGPILAGYIFDVTGSYYYALWLALIATLIGLVLVCLMKPPGKLSSKAL